MAPSFGPPGPALGPRDFLTEQEKASRPQVDRALLRRIFSYLSPYKLQLAVILLINLVSAGIGLLPALITAQIVDRALYGENLSLLLGLSLLAAGALVACGLIELAQRAMNSWLSQQVIFDMKNQMYEHLQQMSHSFFTTEPQGDVITRMTSDIEGVQTVLTETLTTLVSNVLVIATTAAALFTINWRLALAGILIVPLMQIPTRLLGKRRWKLLKEAQGKKDEQNQHITETLGVSGSMLVKLFNREALENRRFRAVNRAVTDLTLKEQWAGQLHLALVQRLAAFGPVLVYLVGGLLLIGGGAGLTVGAIVAAEALVLRLYSPVSSLFNIQVSLTRSFALFERIFDYYDREIEIQSCPDPVRRDRVQGAVAFSHVDFAYRPDKPVLRDVTFTIPQGAVYALVGPSGAGKTTVTNLIPRLFDPTGGCVSIDGVDVRRYDLSDLRRSVGIVTQDTYLFNGTVRENLLYAREDASQEDLERACRAANIHDFILSLPEGYDSLVGNRGLKLSGGEKQRVSIARAILKDPSILILDEATSSLDSISENCIQSAVEPLLRGRTSLIIAHRLSTVLSADRILVLQDGRLVDQGSHRELLARSGIYAELYETQFRRALEEERRRSSGGM